MRTVVSLIVVSGYNNHPNDCRLLQPRHATQKTQERVMTSSRLLPVCLLKSAPFWTPGMKGTRHRHGTGSTVLLTGSSEHSGARQNLLFWQWTPSKPGEHLQTYSPKTSPRRVKLVTWQTPSFWHGSGLHGPVQQRSQSQLRSIGYSGNSSRARWRGGALSYRSPSHYRFPR